MRGFNKDKHWLVYPGACIIKLINAVIYGFCYKLECFSLNTRLGWKGQGQTLYLITETVNYGRNKFYDTSPRARMLDEETKLYKNDTRRSDRHGSG
jgi:hypothetical protein